MRLLGYTVEADLRARSPMTHFKIHRDRYGSHRHLVWGKLSLIWGRSRQCERCDTYSRFEELCDDCYAHHYCECGRELCDAAGSPGDGLCRGCA